LHAETVTKEIEFLLLEFLKKYFPGRWYFEAESIRRIPGGIEDYWLLWCNNVPVGFARTKKSCRLMIINWTDLLDYYDKVEFKLL
jgi:hypothetical protein